MCSPAVPDHYVRYDQPIPAIVEKGLLEVAEGLKAASSLMWTGTPILYGLAAYGRDGVRGVIEEMTKELRRIMSMTGTEDPLNVSRDILIEQA